MESGGVACCAHGLAQQRLLESCIYRSVPADANGLFLLEQLAEHNLLSVPLSHHVHPHSVVLLADHVEAGNIAKHHVQQAVLIRGAQLLCHLLPTLLVLGSKLKFHTLRHFGECGVALQQGGLQVPGLCA